MSFWYKDLGIWEFGPFHGTTPRNADVWTFDVKLGEWELWSGTGPHAYVTLFKDGTEVWGKERTPKKCTCYACRMFREPTPEECRKLSEIMNSDDVPTRKLPPRGCQPSDCCGDEEAHERTED